jgi:hypothetical protein
MLTPKDEGIDNWFNYLYIYIGNSFIIYILDVGIMFGKQDVLL